MSLLEIGKTFSSFAELALGKRGLCKCNASTSVRCSQSRDCETRRDKIKFGAPDVEMRVNVKQLLLNLEMML